MNRSHLVSLITYLVLLSAAPALAQTQTPMANSKTDKTEGAMECPDPDAKIACHSFQELLVAKDEDVMYTLRDRLKYGSGQVFICFRPKEDVFFLLWHSECGEWQWEKKERSALFTCYGTAELLRFKNGIFDHGGESAWASGEWLSTDKGRGDATFASEESYSEGGLKGEIEIEGGTVTVSHLFENPNGSTTQYSFKLQKSTRRFTETFTAPKSSENQVAGRCLKWSSNAR